MGSSSAIDQDPVKAQEPNKLSQGLPSFGAPAPDDKALKKYKIASAPKPIFELDRFAVAPAPREKKEVRMYGGPTSSWKGYGSSTSSKSGGLPMRGMSVGMHNPMAMRREAVLDMKAPVKMYSAVTYGGAAAKLLPETVKEENEDDKGAPLLNDND